MSQLPISIYPPVAAVKIAPGKDKYVMRYVVVVAVTLNSQFPRPAESDPYAPNLLTNII